MRDAPWMHNVKPTRTPLQIALADLEYWKAEREKASDRMRECVDGISDALDRVEKHQSRK